MIDKSIIIKAANYYINNDVTLEQAANYVGIKSKKTLNNYFTKIGTSDKEDEKDLYIKIKAKKEQNSAAGKKKGGQTGSRMSDWSDEDVMKLYNYVDNTLATYRQIEADLGIPHSTAYEMLHSDILDYNQKCRIEQIAAINSHQSYSDEQDIIDKSYDGK